MTRKPKKSTKSKHPLSLNIQAALFQWLVIETQRQYPKDNQTDQWENSQLTKYFDPEAIQMAEKNIFSPPEGPDLFTELTFDLLKITPQTLEDTAVKIRALLDWSSHQSTDDLSTAMKLLQMKISPQTQRLIIIFLIRDVLILSSIPGDINSVQKSLESLEGR